MASTKHNDLKKSRMRRRKIVGWSFAFMAAIYAYWIVATVVVIPDFWDPQYANKAVLLRDFIKRHPGKPVCVMLGSSKIDYGVRPAVVEDWMNRPDAPAIFNFGLSGCDLFREWICLRRIVEDGMKPQYMGIEIPAILLHKKQSLYISSDDLVIRARRSEFAQYDHYSEDPKTTGPQLRNAWLQSRFNPAYQYGIRSHSLNQPLWRIVPGLRRLLDTHPYDEWGWLQGIPADADPVRFREALEKNSLYHKSELSDPTITKESIQALDDILAFCKEQHITPFFIMMPEPPEFQALYSPETMQAINTFAADFSRTRGVKIIDARTWVGSDKFLDSLHLLAPGAEQFTKRFVTEFPLAQ